ncbi:MAG: MAPEG family protein [Burkholderiaceae bacterium]
MIVVTTLAAVVLGILRVVLSLNVIQLRRHHNVSLGDGGRASLARAIRAHGNSAEYLPIDLNAVFPLFMNRR